MSSFFPLISPPLDLFLHFKFQFEAFTKSTFNIWVYVARAVHPKRPLELSLMAQIVWSKIIPTSMTIYCLQLLLYVRNLHRTNGKRQTNVCRCHWWRWFELSMIPKRTASLSLPHLQLSQSVHELAAVVLQVRLHVSLLAFLVRTKILVAHSLFCLIRHCFHLQEMKVVTTLRLI